MSSEESKKNKKVLRLDHSELDYFGMTNFEDRRQILHWNIPNVLFTIVYNIICKMADRHTEKSRLLPVLFK